MDPMVEQLKQLRGSAPLTPASDWKKSCTAKLAAHMRATEAPVREGWFATAMEHTTQAMYIFLPQNMARAARPVFTAFLVSVMAASGWIATVSASYSVPGDTLYNVKRAAEKTQVAMASATGSREWETELHLRFATERSREAKEISQKPEHSAEHVTIAMDSLKESLEEVNKKITETASDQPDKAVALAKNVNDTTDVIVANLNEVGKDTAAVDIGLTKNVVETTKLVNETGIKAIEVAIQTQEADQSKVTPESKQEVKDLVVSKIENLSADPVVTTNVNMIAPVVTTTLLTTVQKVQTDIKKDDTSTSTEKIQAAVQQAVQKVEQAAQTSAAAKDAIAEAKVLVDHDQLSEALQKVKEVNTATQDAKQAAVEAHETVKNELVPAVQQVSAPAVDKKDMDAVTNVTVVDSLLTVVTTTPVVVPKVVVPAPTDSSKKTN